MIVEVGRWVLEEACHQGAQWHAGGHKIGVSVNVSCRQLETDELVNVVRTALGVVRIPGVVIDARDHRDRDHEERRGCRLPPGCAEGLGVRIAIDDFGTGYSSLAYLQQFPVDTLKIDRSFISTMAGSSESGTLIRTLVQLGKTLGLETVAEGIEETEQYAQLEREHCDSGQGFLYARPLEVDAVEDFLRCCTHDTTRPVECEARLTSRTTSSPAEQRRSESGTSNLASSMKSGLTDSNSHLIAGPIIGIPLKTNAVGRSRPAATVAGIQPES